MASERLRGYLRLLSVLSVAVLGCTSSSPVPPRVPAIEYAQALLRPEGVPASDVESQGGPRAHLHLVEGERSDVDSLERTPDLLPLQPSYRGPLRNGEVSANPSLWREGEGATSLFHDFRAFQPMDLVTVLVTEVTEGRKQADTRVNSQSSITAEIAAFLGLEKSVPRSNPDVDPTALIDATTATQVEGRGETLRRGQLRGTISCMVQEVLPSGILRIQVNDDEQIMVMSGLVRPRDVNSRNEVDSAKVANMRIDYYGKGTIGLIQSPGWLMRALMKLWPF
jgi:flagellar L-ring protein precursor FlgH